MASIVAWRGSTSLDNSQLAVSAASVANAISGTVFAAPIANVYCIALLIRHDGRERLLDSKSKEVGDEFIDT